MSTFNGILFHHNGGVWPMWTVLANFGANASYLGAAYYYKRSQNDRPILTTDT